MKHPFLLVLVVTLILSALQLHAQQRQSGPAALSAVVHLGRLEGRPTNGIAISTAGLVLVSYSSFDLNTGVQVKAKISRKGRSMMADLQGKVIKLHRQYPLALVQVTLEEGDQLMPVPPVPNGGQIKPGMKCYAIDSAAEVEANDLGLKANEGAVLSAAEITGVASYIQFSSPALLRSTGGPLCNDRGEVMGLVSLNMGEAGGAAFAIPLGAVDHGEFITIEEKFKESLRQSDRGRDWGISKVVDGMLLDDQWKAANGEERRQLLVKAVEVYTDALGKDESYMPGYVGLCHVYRELYQREDALEVIRKGLRWEPGHAVACWQLGELVKELHPDDRKMEDECLEVWLRGLLSGTEDSNAASIRCGVRIAEVYLKREAYQAAAYVLRWADVMAEVMPEVERERREQGWAALEKAITAEQLAAIRSRSLGFSRLECMSLLAGQPLAGEPAAKGVSPEAKKRFKDGVAQKFLPTLIEPPKDGLEVELPGKPGLAVLAHDGWQLAIHFPDIGKVGIFNLATGKMEAELDCADKGARLAAGGRLLIIYMPGTKLIDVYDLSTLQKVGSGISSLPERLYYIGMGQMNPTRMFVLYPGVVNKNHRMKSHVAAYITIPDLRAVKADIKTVGYDANHLSVDEKRTMVGSLSEDGSLAVTSTSGMHFFKARQDGNVDYRYEHVSTTSPSVAASGNYVSGGGAVFRLYGGESQPELIWKGRDHRIVAQTSIMGFPGILEYSASHDGPGFHVMDLPPTRPLYSMPLSRTIVEKMKGERDYMNDDRATLFASAAADRVVYVPFETSKLFLFSLGLKKNLK